MKKWTDEFIPGVLAGIPRSAYRSRVQSELEDHLIAYFLMALVLCLLFAPFYRPRNGGPFLLGDKD